MVRAAIENGGGAGPEERGVGIGEAAVSEVKMGDKTQGKEERTWLVN